MSRRRPPGGSVTEVFGWQSPVPGWDDGSGRSADWRDLARCAETDPETFYPPTGVPATAAKRICASCEVREQCLEFALAGEEQWGIWGGMTEREMRAERLARERATGFPLCGLGRHALTPDRRAPDGKCLACSDAARAAAQMKNELAA